MHLLECVKLFLQFAACIMLPLQSAKCVKLHLHFALNKHQAASTVCNMYQCGLVLHVHHASVWLIAVYILCIMHQ